MTTIESGVRNLEDIGPESALEISDVLVITRKEEGRIEYVHEKYYEGERLIGFRTIRREGKAIIESGFNFNSITGKRDFLFSGVYYGKEYVIPDLRDNGKGQIIFHASKRYDELNAQLEKFER